MFHVLPHEIRPLELDFYQDDRTILSPSLPHRYLMRQIGMGWFGVVESLYPNAEVGTRILVCRSISQSGRFPYPIVHDYLTVRVSRPTLYNGWIHVNVAYSVREDTPYPYDMDGYHAREALFQRPEGAGENQREMSSQLLFTMDP